MSCSFLFSQLFGILLTQQYSSYKTTTLTRRKKSVADPTADEGMFAQFCQQCLGRTVQNKKRKHGQKYPSMHQAGTRRFSASKNAADFRLSLNYSGRAC